MAPEIVRPLLFLHAGFHKTGTTAIQKFAARHRRRLRAGGILYPRLWPATFRPLAGHHFLFHAVAGHEGHVSLAKAQKLVDRWRRRAVVEGWSVLLSSEANCRYMAEVSAGGHGAKAQFAEKLEDLLSGFDVVPVLVVRRQDDFARSLYQEHVISGTGASARASFPDYLSGVAAEKARFLERLRAFQETFGSVRVLVYEELAKESLPAAFLRELGARNLPGNDTQPVRPSLSVAETLVKQQLNRWIETPWQNRLALAWLRSRPVRRVLERELGGIITLWPDTATRARFVAQFDQENATIAREFLNRDGKLFPRFDQDRAADVPPPDGGVVADALKLAVNATRWRLQAIIGRKAVSQLQQGASQA